SSERPIVAAAYQAAARGSVSRTLQTMPAPGSIQTGGLRLSQLFFGRLVCLKEMGEDFRLEHGDERQVPVALRKIEAVSEDKLVGDVEAEIVDGQVDLAPLRLVEQGADAQGSGRAGEQVAPHIVERPATVDDIFNNQHVFAGDIFL